MSTEYLKKLCISTQSSIWSVSSNTDLLNVFQQGTRPRYLKVLSSILVLEGSLDILVAGYFFGYPYLSTFTRDICPLMAWMWSYHVTYSNRKRKIDRIFLCLCRRNIENKWWKHISIPLFYHKGTNRYIKSVHLRCYSLFLFYYHVFLILDVFETIRKPISKSILRSKNAKVCMCQVTEHCSYVWVYSSIMKSPFFFSVKDYLIWRF